MNKVKCEISFKTDYSKRDVIINEIERVFSKIKDRKNLIEGDVTLEMKPFEIPSLSMKRLEIKEKDWL